MKTQEFCDIINSFEIGQEVVVRYFTYNKKDYVDVIGKISNVYNKMDYSIVKKYPKYVIKGDTPIIVLESAQVVNFHNNYNDKNIPKIKRFFQDGRTYCSFPSSSISFIKPASIRAYKIQQLINKKG